MRLGSRRLPSSLATLRDPRRATHLVNPRRGPLLAHLAEPASAAAIARKLGLPRQRVAYHLRALESAGLIECVERRRKGNCVERLMRVTARAFVISPEASGSVGGHAPADRLSAAAQLQAAARTIEEVAALEAKAVRDGKRLATLTLDTAVRLASATARREFTDELTAAISRIVARYHDERAPGGRTFRLVVCAHPSSQARPGERAAGGIAHD